MEVVYYAVHTLFGQQMVFEYCHNCKNAYAVLENFALDLMQIYLYFIFGLQFIEFPVNGKKIL